jgi:hypothetical protein
MSSEPPQISILDARLAEIDTRLRTIQDGLIPDVPSPEPYSARASPRSGFRPSEIAELIEELRRLADTQERLLRTTRGLIASHESGPERGSEYTATRGPVPSDHLDISVGPLHSTDGLRAFAQALSEIPGVRTVDLRGYEGGDRAILDVQLEPRP